MQASHSRGTKLSLKERPRDARGENRARNNIIFLLKKNIHPPRLL